jgi:steroid 5-alpha reductase family enzyme
MIDIVYLYLMNLGVALLFMICVWPFSVIKKDASIVDVFWGLGFVIIAWNTFFHTDGYLPRKILVVLLTTIWGLRLALYIYKRNTGKGEDKRYQAFRAKVGEKYWIWSLFSVFGLQAVLLWLISLSVQASQTSPQTNSLVWTDIVGAVIWTIGFFFEAEGDRQLSKFKAAPENRGKVMNKGLWAYTRHPNYFGESLIWWGMFLIAMSRLENAWVIVSPALITFLLLKVSGVSLTEKSIMETRPEYREYQARTNAFLPWPQKGKDEINAESS